MLYRFLVVGLLISAGSVAWADIGPAGVAGTDNAGESGVVEADGVPWPEGYVPVPEAVELPSQRMLRGTSVTYPQVVLPEPDLRALLIEDEAIAAESGMLRGGISRTLESGVNGQWYDGTGGRLWLASVKSTEAMRLRLHMLGMDLPQGAALYLYSPDEPERILGPYSGTGTVSDGTFWLPSTLGDTVRIEYFDPDPSASFVPFLIDEVAHLYRDDGGGFGLRSWSDCMVDVACSADWPYWQDLSYSVARMYFYSDDEGPGWYLCTGTLLATVNGDRTPYLLTAQHCVDEANEADSLECRWFYQAATCGGNLMTQQVTDQAYVLAHSYDWSLLMLEGVVPPGVFWSGWSTSTVPAGTVSVLLHHPGGLPTKYSRGPAYPYTYDSRFYEVLFNRSSSVGAIYFGTSGSGLWRESDQKLIGQGSATLGDPGCDHLGSSALYGKFSHYYSTIATLLNSGPDDQFESNNSCYNPTPLSPGTYPDLVVKSLAEDWYQLDVPADTRVEIDATFINAHGNIDLELYDACGGSVVASSATFTDNESITYDHVGPATSYLLRVYLANDVRNTYTLTYALDCVTPEFTQQPQPAQTVCTGTTAYLTVAVDIPDAAFQWRRGTTPLEDDGTHIVGATTPQLEIRDLTMADAGSGYNCLVTNTNDGCFAASANAELIVIDPIVFTSQPVDKSVDPGATIVLSVTAEGTSPNYQWYKDGTALTNNGHYYGTQTDDLVIINSVEEDSGDYWCEVTNLCGTVQSDVVSVRVGVPSGCPGDYDCNGVRDFFDIDLLLAALGGEQAWTAKYEAKFGGPPPCDYLANCDANGDGVVNFFDIDAFLSVLGVPCP